MISYRKLNAVIIDDDQNSIDLMRSVISNFVDEIEITGTFTNPVEASKYLNAGLPDILFVDIEMPELDGISLVKLLDPGLDCMVVFVTGHSEHAIEAMQVGARGYLLKPVSPNNLREVVTSLLKQFDNSDLLKSGQMFNKLLVKKLDSLTVLDINDILYFEADRAYTTIYSVTEDPIRSSKPLGTYKKVLAGYTNFMEVNRSVLLNLNHLRSINKEEEHSVVVMKNGNKLKLSNRNSYSLIQVLEKLVPHNI